MSAVGFYHTEEGVDRYVEMAEGYDGAVLVDRLKRHLPDGSSVLEIGMGPGVDLDILARSYSVTGSDYSQVFLDRYARDHPGADLLLLDAVTLGTERRFDCLYSNKVLHHLSADELRSSFAAQAERLNPGGCALHSFWWGDKGEEWMEGLRFSYYTETALASVVGGTGFEIVEMERYTELEEGDSLVVLLRLTRLGLRVLPERLAVSRLPAGSGLPDWASAPGGFRSVSWTDDETSLVSEASAVPAGVRSEGGWRALMLVGPFDLGATGVLARVAQPLADAKISIFALSTFDTDYILVRDSALEQAVQVLTAHGHRVA